MKRHREKKHSEQPSAVAPQGFTLIEILIAIVILAVGILTVSQMTVMGMKTTVLIEHHMESRSLLARAMEVVRLLEMNDPLLAETVPDSTLLDNILMANVADTTNIVGKTLGITPFDVYWNVTDSVPKYNTKTIRMLVYRDNRLFIKADYVKWR